MKGNILNDTIELSLIEKNYNGSQNIWFESKKIQIKDLEKIFKTKNYSTIKWRDGNRKENNFLSSAGYIVDIDEGLSIHDAETRLKKHKLNYIIAPSKSHTPEKHRYHIVLLFNRTVRSINTYKKIAKHLTSELFPESDQNVSDGARYIYGSPDTVNATSWFEGNYFEVDKFGELWDSSLEFMDSDDNTLTVGDLDESEKTKIHCPFHNDENPSAFVEYSARSDNWYIYCSSCGKTFWKEKNANPNEVKCKDLWSHTDNVYQFGIAGEEFFIERVGLKKFYAMTGSSKPTEKENIYRYLIKHKHIPHITRVDHLADIDADKSYYNVNLSEGVIKVHYSGIEDKIKDNQFVENYLEDTFKQYKDFIKEYLAVFCYTNYLKLPTLVLSGDRGTGKSTFVEIVGDIFKPLTTEWCGNESNFTPEVEKKLLIVEENDIVHKSQYKTLKKYSGQKYSKVNKKFTPVYSVRNNMNIILLSNDAIALYVKKEELPADGKNNQFLVFEFQQFKGPIDASIQDKILDRLGHYIRTELKSVYDHLNFSSYRYSINVPITDAEKALFRNNATDIELDTDKFIQQLNDLYNSKSATIEPGFIDEGFLVASVFDTIYFVEKIRNKVIRNLYSRRFLKDIEPIKKQINKKRLYCYTMTDRLKNEITKSFSCKSAPENRNQLNLGYEKQ
ncbi:MAG: hypothetical protein ISS81_01385 [Candidatus Marinimicrobia bacterium]|nr:hypothetical protein [Candidatus Neomarinimicrobiota bacterium]